MADFQRENAPEAPTPLERVMEIPPFEIKLTPDFRGKNGFSPYKTPKKNKAHHQTNRPAPPTVWLNLADLETTQRLALERLFTLAGRSEIPPQVSATEIKSLYRMLLKRTHPDLAVHKKTVETQGSLSTVIECYSIIKPLLDARAKAAA